MTTSIAAKASANRYDIPPNTVWRYVGGSSHGPDAFVFFWSAPMLEGGLARTVYLQHRWGGCTWGDPNEKLGDHLMRMRWHKLKELIDKGALVRVGST